MLKHEAQRAAHVLEPPHRNVAIPTEVPAFAVGVCEAHGAGWRAVLKSTAPVRLAGVIGKSSGHEAGERSKEKK